MRTFHSVMIGLAEALAIVMHLALWSLVLRKFPAVERWLMHDSIWFPVEIVVVSAILIFAYPIFLAVRGRGRDAMLIVCIALLPVMIGLYLLHQMVEKLYGGIS